MYKGKTEIFFFFFFFFFLYFYIYIYNQLEHIKCAWHAKKKMINKVHYGFQKVYAFTICRNINLLNNWKLMSSSIVKWNYWRKQTLMVFVRQGTNLVFLLLHFTIWYLLSAEEQLGLIGIFYGQ